MRSHRTLVLGCGMIGSAVALDLSRHIRHRVTVADADGERLQRFARQHSIQTIEADLAQPDVVAALASTHDLVIGALPSSIAFGALQAVIESGRPVVDVSFMAADARALDALARERGVAAIIDCGIAPGLSHMMAAAGAALMSPCERISIYVGGLPERRQWPYEYKAGFSLEDVIEEYVRPAMVVDEGRVIYRESLSDPELVDIPGVGTLEAFLTDGLRSLADTVAASFMTEKTLRYPGHRHLMQVLRDSGFFSTQSIDIGGQAVRPIDLTTALLFPQWTFAEGEADVTVLRVAVEGRIDGDAVRYVWDLVDRYDPATGLRSMSRTTAFTATIVADLVADGRFTPGVHPPQVVGQQGLLDVVVGELDRRGVHCTLQIERSPTGS